MCHVIQYYLAATLNILCLLKYISIDEQADFVHVFDTKSGYVIFQKKKLIFLVRLPEYALAQVQNLSSLVLLIALMAAAAAAC